MKDICVRCGLEMIVGQVGVAVIEILVGSPEPYTLTYADVRECPNCGREVVCPSSAAPTIQHHDAKFEKEMALALSLAEAGKLRIIAVYERANMAPVVGCGDCEYWQQPAGRYGICRRDRETPCDLRHSGKRLCSYFTPKWKA